jgi:hypothetical protein
VDKVVMVAGLADMAAIVSERNAEFWSRRRARHNFRSYGAASVTASTWIYPV